MGLFSHDGSKKHICDMPTSFAADAPEPFIGDLSFHQLNMAVSGGCAAFACLSIFILMTRHATHFSKPNEQTKILKICALIPVYAVLSFITIAVPDTYIYLSPWIEVYQAIALGSFFLLLCEFVSPSAQYRDVFFAALEVPQSRKARKQGRQIHGLEWYRKQWFAIFQYPIVAVGVAIVTDATQPSNIFCLESSNIHFAHLWCSIASNVSVTIAVMSVIRFYSALKKELKHHKPLAKLLAFKLMVGLTVVQRIVFQILRSTGALKESSKLTYADVNFGIQTMAICCEMVPFSIFFHWAYNVSPYNIKKPALAPISELAAENLHPESTDRPYDQYNQYQQGYHVPGSPPKRAYYGGPLGIRAWLTVPNPMEILSAIRFAFVMRSESRRMEQQGQASMQYHPDPRRPGYA